MKVGRKNYPEKN